MIRRFNLSLIAALLAGSCASLLTAGCASEERVPDPKTPETAMARRPDGVLAEWGTVSPEQQPAGQVEANIANVISLKEPAMGNDASAFAELLADALRAGSAKKFGALFADDNVFLTSGRTDHPRDFLVQEFSALPPEEIVELRGTRVEDTKIIRGEAFSMTDPYAVTFRIDHPPVVRPGDVFVFLRMRIGKKTRVEGMALQLRRFDGAFRIVGYADKS